MLKVMNFKKAVLLIHGFAGGNYDFGELINDLQTHKSLDIFTFTLPGHEKGRITKVTKEDWIQSAENQIEKIIKNGYKKIYIIGHSMGGILAVHLACKYPQIKKLVLAAPAYKHFMLKDNKLDIIEGIKKIPKIFKDFNYEEVMSRIMRIPTTAIKEFVSLADAHLNDIKNITIPTLILYGSNDNIVPIDSIDHVYDNIKSKSVTLIELDKLNHNIFTNDRYEETKKIIVNFLIGYNFSAKERKKI